MLNENDNVLFKSKKSSYVSQIIKRECVNK